MSGGAGGVDVDHDVDVLIVGAGLTAVDIIVQLSTQGHRGRIHALSRRGLLPQVHKAGPAYAPFLAGETLPTTVTGALHRIRSEVRKAASTGADWRGVVDAIRPQTQGIWRGWSWEQRARFLRHLRPYWEVHRHRLAPEIAAHVETIFFGPHFSKKRCVPEESEDKIGHYRHQDGHDTYMHFFHCDECLGLGIRFPNKCINSGA